MNDGFVTPLHIALVSLDYPPDPKGTGIGTYSKLLAQQLTERGHRVEVVTRGFGADTSEVQDSVTVHRLGRRPEVALELSPLKVMRLALGSAMSEISYRRKVARKLVGLVANGVQLIESSEAFADSLFYHPARHPNVPFIVKLHTPFAVGELFDKNLPEPMRRAVREVERQLIRRASHVTIPSGAGKALFRREMRLGNLAIHTLANPPQLNLPDASGDSDSQTVLFVGRVTRFKGVNVLVQAIPQVLAAVPDTQFVFVGADAPQTGQFRSTIASLKAQLPAEARAKVSFTGHVQRQDLDSYYQQAALCVFPSLFEVFGYTCLEAMCHGKAIVGSANGGMNDLLDSGRCGLLYTPPDSEELARLILKLLNDKDLRQSLGARARERALTTFGAEHVMSDTEAFYRQALDDCS